MASFFAFLASSSFVYIDHFGLTPTQFSVAFSVNAIGFIGASQFAATLGARFGMARVVIGAVSGYALFAVILFAVTAAGVDSLAVLIALLLVAFACLGLVIPATMVLALEDHGPIAGMASALGGTLQMVAGGAHHRARQPVLRRHGFADGDHDRGLCARRARPQHRHLGLERRADTLPGLAAAIGRDQSRRTSVGLRVRRPRACGRMPCSGVSRDPRAYGKSTMPEKRTIEKARKAKRAGKSPTTQAGEFVREEIEDIRRGEHGARSAKQAIAIGLSKARRAGVKLPPPKKGEAKRSTRRSAEYAYEAGQGRRKPQRRPRVSRAVSRVLKEEPRSSASRKALSRQAKGAASRRSTGERSAAAKKAARTKGASTRSAAARKGARTRARRRRSA